MKIQRFFELFAIQLTQKKKKTKKNGSQQEINKPWEASLKFSVCVTALILQTNKFMYLFV